MNSLAVICHTFNRYEHLWDGFLDGWWKNIAPSPMDLFIGTDTPDHGEHELFKFQYLYSGAGEWSDRLKNLLNLVPHEYVLYIQEDMWPAKSLPELCPILETVNKLNLVRLQISAVNQFYSLTGSSVPLFFHHKSKYLVSHQPSIWKKSFLLSCLEHNETPWVHEYEGTKRLAERKEEIERKIAIIPHDWYQHKCVKGQVVD